MDEHIGSAEHMARLWAPWRVEYIRHSKGMECVLCTAPAGSDDETNLVLYRGRWNFVMMNAFPYSPGHLMVAPYQHTADLTALTPEQTLEHHHMIKLGVALLTKVAHPNGFNVGLNLGRAAGAGFDQHLHTHIVPRWLGDTNFMPVLARTRVMSESLTSMYRRLSEALEDVEADLSEA